jgi:glycine/D-amino acid oxidase-like deaminating enzyme
MLQLPDSEKSLWREFYPSEALYPKLDKDIEVDVVVVGAGITGLTTAYLLKQSGQRVAVLEKDTVGGGTTGRTTGKVTSQHNLVYKDLLQRFGQETARLYGEANQAAVSLVDSIIQKEQIDCAWQRDDSYVYTVDRGQIATFEQEAKVAASMGLPASFEKTTPLPFEVQAAVRFTGQGKFYSEKYLVGLAEKIRGNGSYIFEHSTVIGIRDGDHCRVKTKHAAVTAYHIVVATNVPTSPLMARGGYCLLEYPIESYIVAGRAAKQLKGMYISPDKHQYSILPVEANGQRLVLIGGEGRFSATRGNKNTHYRRLADYAEKYLGVTTLTHRWSDRDYLAYDDIPLIGKLYPWSKHLYVATAFKKWGLSHGTVAGIILCDLILGKENPWATVFNSNRLRPITSIPHAFFARLGR